MKTLTDFMPGMAGYWTKELRSSFANREYLNWFCMSAGEMNGIHMKDLLGSALFAEKEPYIRAALAGEIQKFEHTLTKSNGETKETLIHYIPHLEGAEVLGFFVLILDITEHKHMEAALIAVAEARQRALGQELHDNLGQQIAAIAYQSKALEKRLLSAGDANSAKIAASVAIQAQHAVMQCKQLAQGLLPFELESNGLPGALQELASRISTSYDVNCHFVCKYEVFVDKGELALNLYRIAQEAINNAIRHGGAKHLIITLTLENACLCLSICDDGCSFAVDTKLTTSSGMGIKIMLYRANQIGAMLKFLTRAEGGTEVRVEMRAS
ncbi:MAG: PAS domain-containing protein [Gallionellaceae bacterium]